MAKYDHECVEEWLAFASSKQHFRGWQYEACTLKTDMGVLPAGTRAPFVIIDFIDSMIYVKTDVEEPWCPCFPYRICPSDQDTSSEDRIKCMASALHVDDTKPIHVQALDVMDKLLPK